MTDWPALIERLERAGLRHIDIGSACERSEGWVGLLKRGVIKQPSWPQGEALRALDQKVGQRVRETLAGAPGASGGEISAMSGG